MNLLSASVPMMRMMLAFVVAILTVGSALTTAKAATSGDPIDMAGIADYGTSAVGEVLNIAAAGMNMSFYVQNSIRGGISGRPLRYIVRNTDGNASLVYPFLTEIMALSPNLSTVIGVRTDAEIHEAQRFISDASPTTNDKLLLYQPLSVAQEFYTFNNGIANILAAPDTEVLVLIQFAVYQNQITRAALVTEVSLDSGFASGGYQLADYSDQLFKEVGVTRTHKLQLNAETNLNGYDDASINALIATNPHAVIFLSDLYPNTAATLATLLLNLPDALMLMSITLLPLVDLTLQQLPSSFGRRVILSNYGPLYTDLSFDAVKRFRSEVALLNSTTTTLAALDASPTMGVFFMFGWLAAENFIQMVSRIPVDTINGPNLIKNVFSDSIYTIDDYVVGPYSRPCSGQKTYFCECNNGARKMRLSRFTDQLTLTSVPDFDYDVPLSDCGTALVSLTSHLGIATIQPSSSPEAALITSEFSQGRKAAITTTMDTAISGTVIYSNYTTTSTASLQSLFVEHLLTVSAGSVLNTPLQGATGIGAVLDPVEVQPRLYGGFSREVVYISPTYEQEIHAIASYAATRKMDVRVMSALEDGASIGEALTRSMHTFGVEGGGNVNVPSIKSGLDSLGDTNTVYILHGITTKDDADAIAAFLTRTTNAAVAIPMPHLLVWYNTLLSSITDESQSSRLLLATSLPNWAGPVEGETTGSALQTFFDRIPVANRTPGALRGFMTQQLITYVATRIPTQKSPSEFLKMLYGASVVVMDTGLVAGPFYDAACSSSGSSSTSTSCEMNIGARVIRIFTLASAAPRPSSSTSNVTTYFYGREASSITLESGTIAYKDLPAVDNTLRNIVIIVATVGGALLLIGIAAILLIFYFSGRNHRHAPTNEKNPFTIVFTDIQSSTMLWAEVPETMALALDHHHDMIRRLCSRYNGYEVKTIGDAFMIAYKEAADAVNFASDLQFDFYKSKKWSGKGEIDHSYLDMDAAAIKLLTDGEITKYSCSLSSAEYKLVWNGLRVRVGIHTGFGEIKKDPVSHGYDYYGTVVNTAARTESIAHGGQVILTEAALSASGIERGRAHLLGPVLLRGVPDPVTIYELPTILGRVFPPLRIEKASEEITLTPQATKEEMSGGSSGGHSVGGPSIVGSNSMTSIPVSTRESAEAIDNVAHLLMAAMSGPARIEWLRNLCHAWRVVVPTDLPSKASDKQSSADSDLLTLLKMKLAPILARKKKVKPSATNGGTDDNQSFGNAALGIGASCRNDDRVEYDSAGTPKSFHGTQPIFTPLNTE